jgi:hypothetical protein
MIDGVDIGSVDEVTVAPNGEAETGHNSPRLKLSTGTEVAREFRRLYREARSGKIDTADAERLGNLLTALARTIPAGT